MKDLTGLTRKAENYPPGKVGTTFPLSQYKISHSRLKSKIYLTCRPHLCALKEVNEQNSHNENSGVSGGFGCEQKNKRSRKDLTSFSKVKT